MGNYTQFNATISLRKDTPDDVVLLIHHAIYDDDFGTIYIGNGIESQHPLILPEHRFFKTERWYLIFMRRNYYGEGAKFTKSRSGYYDLVIQCDINHGYHEVESFIEWITPYVAGRKKKQYIGWWKSEHMNWRQNEYIER